MLLTTMLNKSLWDFVAAAGGPAEPDQGIADKIKQEQPLSGKQSWQVSAQARMHPTSMLSN